MNEIVSMNILQANLSSPIDPINFLSEIPVLQNMKEGSNLSNRRKIQNGARIEKTTN
jgi:hypothetical protein